MKTARLMTTVISKCMQLKVKQLSGIMIVVRSEKGGKKSLRILRTEKLPTMKYNYVQDFVLLHQDQILQ
jgi:hypothetical protein